MVTNDPQHTQNDHISLDLHEIIHRIRRHLSLQLKTYAKNSDIFFNEYDGKAKKKQTQKQK